MMNLVDFKEKFVEAFHEYCVDHCNGNTGKLINLQNQFGDTAISYYDSLVDNKEDITEESLKNCIEIEQERLNTDEEDKSYMEWKS